MIVAGQGDGDGDPDRQSFAAVLDAVVVEIVIDVATESVAKDSHVVVVVHKSFFAFIFHRTCERRGLRDGCGVQDDFARSHRRGQGDLELEEERAADGEVAAGVGDGVADQRRREADRVIRAGGPEVHCGGIELGRVERVLDDHIVSGEQAGVVHRQLDVEQLGGVGAGLNDVLADRHARLDHRRVDRRRREWADAVAGDVERGRVGQGGLAGDESDIAGLLEDSSSDQNQERVVVRVAVAGGRDCAKGEDRVNSIFKRWNRNGDTGDGGCRHRAGEVLCQ